MSAWNAEQLFSSKSIEWATPQDLFDALNQEFHFDLDAAASHNNAKCPNYIATFSLDKPWPGNSVFLNPPWGRSISRWLAKAYQESREPRKTVVCLIPACTDTKWWRDYVWKAAEVRLITGRLKFVRDDGHTGPSPKGACLAIFTSWAEGPPRVRLV